MSPAGARPIGTSFVSRTPGAWALSLPGDSAVVPVDLAGVLEALGGADAAPPAASPAVRPDLPGHLFVAPPWCLVGRVERGSVVFGTASGEGFEALPQDLVLLDLLDHVQEIDSLRARAPGPIDDALARLVAARLVRIGRPEDLAPQAAGGGGAPVEAVAPAPAARRDPGPSVDLVAERAPGPAGDRIPVYAIWHEDSGPMLSLGMLTASARHALGGQLNDHFEIRRPESSESFLADLARRTGPAVLLCSDYVWSLEDNLASAREGLAINPDLFVVHGGPSCPKYEGDAEQFLRDHGPVARILTRGEGEELIVELLSVLASTGVRLDASVLGSVAGLTFVDPRTGAVVRTADRERIAVLDELPSPYLTGEFDAIPARCWATTLSIETNRGCPYGCTYCDWGSSTLSRVRKFDHERVKAEIAWAARRGLESLNLTDANFGIMSRDVGTAQAVAEQRQLTGYPKWVSFYPAKNTTKHLVKIMDILVGAQVSTIASISLQTTDPATLEAIDRANISTDHYVALAADYRRRGYPLQGELILGLPGQTYDSYRRDLQFNLDHEIQTRTWRLRVLPNAPMNDPAYRAEHAIVVDDRDLVQATSTFDEADRERMIRLQALDIIFERNGLLRHVLRVVQWDHGIDATVVMDHILRLVSTDPDRYPHIAWVVNHFHHLATGPAGWRPFYAEVAAMLAEDFGIRDSAGLATALVLNEFLMPYPGRQFPDTVVLGHDYVSYYRDATRSLFDSGHAASPDRTLDSYGPAELTIWSDPLQLCEEGLHFATFTSTDGMDGDFAIGANAANELLSPLTRLLPHLITIGVTLEDLGPTAPAAQGLHLVDADQPEGDEHQVPVSLGRRR